MKKIIFSALIMVGLTNTQTKPVDWVSVLAKGISARVAGSLCTATALHTLSSLITPSYKFAPGEKYISGATIALSGVLTYLFVKSFLKDLSWA